MSRYISWFSELSIADVPLVGGKNASLGEMYRELTPQGIAIPNGFAVTADGYRAVIKEGRLAEVLQRYLKGLDTGNLADLAERGRAIRDAILNTPLPEDLQTSIVESYRKLGKEFGQDPDVAVRSSATAEDLPGASFAGQQESFLNIRGERALLDTCRQCLASLFTDRAISYRVDKGFDHFAVALSIGVQKMIRSDLACSGVLFTLDTESGFPDVVLINSAFGLGETIVKGRVDPDEFLVFKPMLEKTDLIPIIKRRIGSKHEKMIYASRGGKSTRIVAVPQEQQQSLSLTDEEVLTLARWGCLIEKHYSNKSGQAVPMDIEWAKDGQSGRLFILQARPETVHAMKKKAEIEIFELQQKAKVILQGKSVGARIGAGAVRVIRSTEELSSFRQGEVLVADMTDPDWEPTMKMAAAVVTNRGGRTCHAAIVSRELGVPCVVGTEQATALLKPGQPITVSCADGDVGKVYDGKLPFERTKIDVSKMPRPRTKVMMNLGDPDKAFALCSLPNDGVGLAREEFIISSFIRVHPLALLRFDELPAGQEKEEIARLTRNHPNKADYFVEKLAEGVGQLAAAFYPRDVIVRLSDFKSNEYAGLLGGKPFEPVEENPMIGFRGASRYYDPRYQEGFLLECQAMRQAREVMGLTNIKLMIPFCRTVEEGEKVLAVMEKAGLKRGQHGLEVYVMCEIPSNVVLAEDFARIFDGFSIGSNDLTQLILGLDRDSSIVAHLFDERNPAVMRLIEDVIKRVKARGKKIGICGQAPSDYPEFAQFLVRCGIDSISLTPDTILKTTQAILEMEKQQTSVTRKVQSEN